MMNRRILLMLWIISFLFVGFVLSESASSTNGSSSLSPTRSTIGFTSSSSPETADEKIERLFLHGREGLCKRLVDGKIGISKFMKKLEKSEDFKEKFIPVLLGNDSSAAEITGQLLNDNDQKNGIIDLLLNDATAKQKFEPVILKDGNVVQKVMGNITGKEMAKVVSHRNDAINAIAGNDGQMNLFIAEYEFRKAFIKKLLKDYKKELTKEDEFGEAITAASINYFKENSTKAMHALLKENSDYVLILKLLILSPMIIAWTASLICIASMCGVCYPFGLSEPSAKKSKEKKDKKKRGSQQ